MTLLKISLRLAGATHFGILIASAITPGTLDWRGALASLPPLLRQLFWVYGIFIAFVIAAFGALTLLHADALAAGDPLARGLCGFIAIFWLGRLGVQFFVFDARPFLTNWFLKLGYHTLTVAFAFLGVVYAVAALPIVRP